MGGSPRMSATMIGPVRTFVSGFVHRLVQMLGRNFDLFGHWWNSPRPNRTARDLPSIMPLGAARSKMPVQARVDERRFNEERVLGWHWRLVRQWVLSR
jgi:hypothetical protein